MEIAARQGNLEALAQLLQERLRSQPAIQFPGQIRCALQKGRLLVLGEHPANTTADTQAFFWLLEKTLQTLQPEFTQTAHLYLRICRQKRPYACHKVEIQPSAQSAVSSRLDRPGKTNFAPKTNPAAETNPALAIDPSKAPDAFSNPLNQSESETAAPERPQPPASPPTPIVATEEPLSADSEQAANLGEVEVLSNPMAVPALAGEDPALAPGELVPTEDRDDRLETPPTSIEHKHPLQSKLLQLPLLASAGIAAGTVLLVGSLYAITRPCAIGACPQIQQAQKSIQTSQQGLQKASSRDQLLASRKQLSVAIQALAPIPVWSRHHSEAQALLASHRQQAAEIDTLVAALDRALDAANKSQKAPHPVETWKSIQLLWQQAIAQLEQIPTTNPAYGLAQRKLQQYRANLAAIDQRIRVEQQSQTQLTTAKAAAQAAEARQGTAQSLESWQQVYNTWMTAMRALQQIPQGTMAYQSVARLKERYHPKLAAARDRKTQEELAANLYNKAIDFAQQAQNLEQKKQWPQAMENWQKALSYAKQVPKGTLYHPQAQPLLASFTQSLETATAKSNSSGFLQKARTDLERTCLGAQTICSYAIANNQIRVRTTQAYEQSIQQALDAATASGNYEAKRQVQAHVQAVLQALAIISDNAKMPLEIYNANGSRFGSHTPGIPGYQR